MMRPSCFAVFIVVPLLASCVAPTVVGDVAATDASVEALDAESTQAEIDAVEGDGAFDLASVELDDCGDGFEDEIEDEEVDQREIAAINRVRLGDADLSALPRGGAELYVREEPLSRALATGERAYLVTAHGDSSLALVRTTAGSPARVDVLPAIEDIDTLSPVEILERGHELWGFGHTFATRSSGERWATVIARYDGRAWQDVPWEGDPIIGARVSADGAILVTTDDDEDARWRVLPGSDQ